MREVHLIDAAELASGDLSRYNVIVTGVRAYERRPDLRANNNRLLNYVENGGTVIVHYNKQEFNQAQYGPYPVEDRDRPDHRRERTGRSAGPDPSGLQHAEQDRARGVGRLGAGARARIFSPTAILITSTSSGPPIRFRYNAGAKTGALVEARYGKGRWIYVGLGLWRQLPAGTDGAYELMANLLSLGKQ